MSFIDQLLAALLTYGVPLLFTVITISAAGVPFPVSLTLVAAGSFAKQGEMNLWPIIVGGSLAAILGDQIGYGLSRWGGRQFGSSDQPESGRRIKNQRSRGPLKEMGWRRNLLQPVAHHPTWTMA